MDTDKNTRANNDAVAVQDLAEIHAGVPFVFIQGHLM